MCRCRAGSPLRLTRDHTPADAAERARVASAGGEVVERPDGARVAGMLQARARGFLCCVQRRMLVAVLDQCSTCSQPCSGLRLQLRALAPVAPFDGPRETLDGFV